MSQSSFGFNFIANPVLQNIALVKFISDGVLLEVRKFIIINTPNKELPTAKLSTNESSLCLVAIDK